MSVTQVALSEAERAFMEKERKRRAQADLDKRAARRERAMSRQGLASVNLAGSPVPFHTIHEVRVAAAGAEQESRALLKEPL